MGGPGGTPGEINENRMVPLKERIGELGKTKTLKKKIGELESQVQIYQLRAKRIGALSLGKRKSPCPPGPAGHNPALSQSTITKAIEDVGAEVTQTYGPALKAAQKDKERCKALMKKLRAAHKAMKDAQTSSVLPGMPPKSVTTGDLVATGQIQQRMQRVPTY